MRPKADSDRWRPNIKGCLATLRIGATQYDASLEWHRDKYLMAVQSAASGGSIYQAAQGQLDASAQINLTDRIRLVLEGVNLDRTTAKQYLQYPGRLYTTLREDRRVFFGVAATF